MELVHAYTKLNKIHCPAAISILLFETFPAINNNRLLINIRSGFS